MSETSGKVGQMTVDRWFAEGHLGKSRVLLNGEDITDRCRWFDDIAGEAELIVQPPQPDPSGPSGHHVLTERVQGEITVVERKT